MGVSRVGLGIGRMGNVGSEGNAAGGVNVALRGAAMGANPGWM